MAVRYQETVEGITPDYLQGGFFAHWHSNSQTAAGHLVMLQNSDVVVLALSGDSNVVGFVNALTDGAQSAFIPFLEVLPAYRGQGIGSELMRRALKLLGGVSSLDLTCNPELQPFYARFGMRPSVGMIRRSYMK